MKRMIPLIICAALIVSSLSGCVAVNFMGRSYNSTTVTGTGDKESYEFTVGDYSAIRVEGYCDVWYYSAPSDIVTLEVQPNLREYFTVEVVNGELIVRTPRGVNINTPKTPVLMISTPVLESLTIEGFSTFTAYDKITGESFTLTLGGRGNGRAELDVDTLSVDMAGMGNFELSGRADSAGLNMSGAGNLNALALQTRDANVTIAGMGTVRISCSDNLTVDAGGMGTVEYRGSPSTNINTGGMVSIKRVD